MTSDRKIVLQSEEGIPLNVGDRIVLSGQVDPEMDGSYERQNDGSFSKVVPGEVGVIDSVRVVDSPYMSRGHRSGLTAQALLALASLAVGDFVPARRYESPTGEGHIKPDLDFSRHEQRILRQMNPTGVSLNSVSSKVHDSSVLDRADRRSGLYGDNSRFRPPRDEPTTRTKKRGSKKASVEANRRKMAKASRVTNRRK